MAKSGISKKIQAADSPDTASRGGWVRRLLLTSTFQKVFAWVSVGVLIATTLYWAALSAILHEANADQLIDAYLFENSVTFQSALFPGAHTFLLKWPLFILMYTFGHQPEVFLAATLGVVLATVGFLVYLLYKIEPRPVVFGLLCLCLASVLLLIPAQPYPGALLPVNFAMTTTRNLEYVVFVWCLWRLARGVAIRSIEFWVLALAMAVLIASDKLFVALTLGGGLILLAGYVGILRHRTETALIRNWLLLGAAAAVFANILLLAISGMNITNIVNESTASPFPLIQSASQLVQGMVYGAGAVLTNFGANPVHDVIVIRDIPEALSRGVTSPVILAYMFNLVLLSFALFAAYKAVTSRISDRPNRLAVLLSASTLAALIVFILTDHYYPVDSRYLAIQLFALFIAMAVYLRNRHISMKVVLAVTGVLLFVLPLGMLRTWQEYRSSQAALGVQTALTRTVAGIIDKERISRLIGDYWDITPVKPRTSRNVTIAPVENCDKPRAILNSLAWFEESDSKSAAFLAVRDPGKSTYDGCSLARLAVVNGTPSKRVLITPNPEPPYDPNVMLLVYANGLQPLAQEAPESKSNKTSEPPAPRTVSAMRDRASCKGTSLNVVAHQDDDLLFMNPDVLEDVRAKRCIRTVYLTAGDAGEASAYWMSRETGAKAAYAEMYGVPSVWRDERELIAGRFVTVSYLQDAPYVSLVFLRLPDGNLRGEGFASTNSLSLQMLTNDQAAKLAALDDRTEYDKAQLVAALREILRVDASDLIRTLGSENTMDGDHSDHHAAGALTELALTDYAAPSAVFVYGGYPIMYQPVNLSEAAVASKQNAFMAYAKYDGAVCQSVFECQQLITYGSYLTRQYKSTPITAAP